jgi:hypothetical protein
MHVIMRKKGFVALSFALVSVQRWETEVGTRLIIIFSPSVVPAEAGIQRTLVSSVNWIPACAGMTVWGLHAATPPPHS